MFSLLPVGIYTIAPQLARRANLRIGTRQDIPYRNDYEYFLRPWKTGYVGAERFATEALQGVEQPVTRGRLAFADHCPPLAGK